MNSQLEPKIGFDRIRQMLAERCSNALAQRMTQEMAFDSNFDSLVQQLRQTDEMKHIVMFSSAFPQQEFIDLTEVLSALRIENTAIEQTDLFDLKCSMQTIHACLDFLLNDENEQYPELRTLAQQVQLDPSLLRQASKIIDDKGEIYDNASPDLLDIRQQMQRKQASVDTYLNRALTRAKQEGWTSENAEPTIRNGRMVIPLLDTHRRKMKGLIHGESATRQTAYVEPAEVVELNNDLRELEFAEQREIFRILLQYSNLLRTSLPYLIDAYWFLARIDFIRAKARLALDMNADMPLVVDHPQIAWMQAYHPLLLMQRKAERGSNHGVEPFNMSLATPNSPERILIISGPNAGGKSVCLKAVGLIQYMLQCGLLVPCRATSEFGLFRGISIDIGDQQSIDNDLSTYTSHLQNMKQLLSEADSQTLFLLDELGGGTEPRSGCAIAEALLEELDRREAIGVVTTHFADLKLMADSHPAIVNGAMLFDTEKMRPLYRLSVGHPGSSFAFEIASNVGIPSSILDAASQKVGSAMLNFEHQLQQLELDKQQLADDRARLDAADQLLAEVIAKYETLNDQLQQRKHEIISQARSQARQIMEGANRTVEQTISDIRSAQAERLATQQARQRLLSQAEENLKAEQQAEKELSEIKKRQQQRASKSSPKPPTTDETPTPIVIGTIVRIDGQDTFGQVVEIKGKKAIVESNSLRMSIPLDRLSGTAKKDIPTVKNSRQSYRFQSIYDDINEKRKHFNPTLDLRGQRADEALSNLQYFIDDAQLLGEKELRILHGKGYGILKQLIREWLQSNHDVHSFRSERVELGGDGITVVTMR
ncbi:MAG: Smr/MutS family protein [Bacteroidales bacterium]|nr:Smr/MutS family protein [Bacteroidales bacterium]